MAESKEKLQKLPLGEIKPMGWLKRELELQATGLTGRLDELWEDVSKKSAWLGGHGEAWERGPYYLDGLVSLAYLLDDRRLIDRVGLWIEKSCRRLMPAGFSGLRARLTGGRVSLRFARSGRITKLPGTSRFRRL